MLWSSGASVERGAKCGSHIVPFTKDRSSMFETVGDAVARRDSGVGSGKFFACVKPAASSSSTTLLPRVLRAARSGVNLGILNPGHTAGACIGFHNFGRSSGS